MYLTAYKTHGCIGRTKNKVDIKRDETNKMSIINDNNFNDNNFNLHNSFLNNGNRYMKVTLKSKLVGVARLLISADIWHIRCRGILKDIFIKKKICALYAVCGTILHGTKCNNMLTQHHYQRKM